MFADADWGRHGRVFNLHDASYRFNLMQSLTEYKEQLQAELVGNILPFTMSIAVDGE